MDIALAFALVFLAWLSCIAVAPTEALAIIKQAAGILDLEFLVDGEFLTPYGYLIAAILLFILSYINILTVRMMTQINNFLAIWKVMAPVFIIGSIALSNFEISNLATIEGIEPINWTGMLQALSTVVIFSYLGLGEVTSLAAETENPQKSIPIAVCGSVFLCIVLYMFIQLVFICSIDEQVASLGYKNITFSKSGDQAPFATLAMGLGLHFTLLTITADTIVSPGGAGLVYTATTARLNYAMAKNKALPKSMMHINNRGSHQMLFGLTFYLV